MLYYRPYPVRPDSDKGPKREPEKGLRASGGIVVGDQERIDVDLAHQLVTRLQAAGLELHQALDEESVPTRQEYIHTALTQVDHCIRLIRHAAFGFEGEGDPFSGGSH